MDPKKLLGKLDQLRKEKPFRHLGRRIIQAVAESAGENPLVSRRSAPGCYLVLRQVSGADERDEWESLFAEGRGALLKELERETASRDIHLRSGPELDLYVVTDEEAARGEAERVLSMMAEANEVASLTAKLAEERELILPRRTRTLLLQSDPPGAAVYVNDRPAGVTPCRVEDLPTGEHTLAFSLPGYLLYEDTLAVDASDGRRQVPYLASLEPEPPMGMLEIKTFPPRARVTIHRETRDSPVRWRLPSGLVEVDVELPEFAPVQTSVNLPPTPDDRPFPLQVRLDYIGAEREEVVGRLIVYKPGTYFPTGFAAPQEPAAPPPNRISSFFQDPVDPDRTLEWPTYGPAVATAIAPPEPEILGERPLRRGVLLIGRADPHGGITPDIKLMDAENSVTRGCHAWVWVYADNSTGATYNTFLVGNNSPAGIRVDGTLVMETRRLSDDSIIQIGNFTMRLVKETPEPRVEFGF